MGTVSVVSASSARYERTYPCVRTEERPEERPQDGEVTDADARVRGTGRDSRDTPPDTEFLITEARRYRGYDMWRSRVRILQRNVFAYSLDPSQGIEDPDWRPRLSRDYREPRSKVSYGEAIAHRLRRVYLPLFTVLLAAWLFRILATPVAGSAWPATAAVSALPGSVVTGVVGAFYVVLVGITFRPRVWQTTGELRRSEVGAWDDIK